MVVSCNLDKSEAGLLADLSMRSFYVPFLSSPDDDSRNLVALGSSQV